MKLIKLILPAIIAFISVPQVALAQNPCSSLATAKPSEQTRTFQNKELFVDIPANFRILLTMQGLMIHSPWSYEVYSCQQKIKYPSGESEEGIVVNLMIPEEVTEYVQGLYKLDSTTKQTYYPGTSAKMFVWSGPESAYTSVLFVRNGKIVCIKIPMHNKDDGTIDTEIPIMYKDTADLIIKTLIVK